jgi:hypothetical protein
LAAIALRFAVSRDEERVDITVLCADREIELPARSHQRIRSANAFSDVKKFQIVQAQMAPVDIMPRLRSRVAS